LLNSSKRIYETILPYLQDLPHEEFWILLLNNRLQLLAAKKVSGGGITATIVNPQIVFKMAIDHLATNIVLCQ
jgi:DNA repair protein RadC